MLDRNRERAHANLKTKFEERKKKILSSIGNVLELITPLYLYHLKEVKNRKSQLKE